jgi:hypothetical protein
MNPLFKGLGKQTNYLQKLFENRIFHISGYSLAMYFFNHGIYSSLRDQSLKQRFDIHNEKYSNDLKDIIDYQKTYAEKTWTLQQVIC